MLKAALGIRKRLADSNPLAYGPDLADSYNNLAVLYRGTQRFTESEKMHKAVLEMRKWLADANPQTYEPDLADSYNNLALLLVIPNAFPKVRRCSRMRWKSASDWQSPILKHMSRT